MSKQALIDLLVEGLQAKGRDKAKVHCRICNLIQTSTLHNCEDQAIANIGGRIDRAIIATMRGEIPIWLGAHLITDLAASYHKERLPYIDLAAHAAALASAKEPTT